MQSMVGAFIWQGSLPHVAYAWVGSDTHTIKDSPWCNFMGKLSYTDAQKLSEIIATSKKLLMVKQNWIRI